MNKKENPVLAIFQDLNEITSILKMLDSKGIKNVNIFDGKDEKIKPEKITGKKGSISLGTNVCGRGTDIKPVKPLHVIISYFTSNSRVIHQAFGRTARQGQQGSVRVICLKEQFTSPIRIYNSNEMKLALNDFQEKNEMQINFINRFGNKRKWIFTGGIKKQILTDDQIANLRSTKININRLIACNFEFPICISVKNFLLIQAQKIFSLYNCPNCKYTWMLFQRYVREMILQSWSLFIEKKEREYNNKMKEHKIKQSYNDYLKSNIDDLLDCLFLYLPENVSPKECEIVPTFMRIFNLIKDKYEAKIINLFPIKLCAQNSMKKFCSFTFGFKPYSLIDESGARIDPIDGRDKKPTYIIDPELIYMKMKPHHHYDFLSITEKIDGIFNMICQKINSIIGSHIGLKFFLRRTLGGCEFGVCYDFNIEFEDSSILKDKKCIVDIDPLLLFTISVKSIIPILAGILIIGLVYIANIAKKTYEWIYGMGAKDIVIYTVKEIATKIFNDQIDNLFDHLYDFLYDQIYSQIEVIKSYNEKAAHVFTLILNLTLAKDFSRMGDEINGLFEGKSKIKIKSISSFIENNIPGQHLFKTGVLLMLCFASFLFNFYNNKKSIENDNNGYDSDKVSEDYDKKVEQKIKIEEQNIKNENNLSEMQNDQRIEEEVLTKYENCVKIEKITDDTQYKFK